MRLAIILSILLFVTLPVQAATNLNPECFASDLCILKEAVSGIKPEDIRTAQDQKDALTTAYYVTLLGNDELRQEILEKIEKIPDTRKNDFYSKTKTKMKLLASLGRISDVMKMLQTLKDQHAAVSDGNEPQKDILVTLASIGKLDEAKKFALEADNIGFDRPSSGPSEDPLGRRWSYLSTPATTLFKAFLNQDRLQDALEIRSKLKNDSVFLQGSYSTPQPTERTNIVIDGIFARYYLAKGTAELMKGHQDVCMSTARKLHPLSPRDLRVASSGNRDAFAPMTKSMSDDELVLATLMYSGCLEKYPDIKIDAEKYSVLNRYIRAPFTKPYKNFLTANPNEIAKKRMQIFKDCQPSSETKNNSICLVKTLLSDAAKKENAQNVSEEFDRKYPRHHTDLQ